LGGGFSAFTFWNTSTVNVAVNSSNTFSLTFTTPYAGVFSGYLSISCIGSASGSTVSLDSNNTPFISLTVTAPSSPSGGGGGGGSTFVSNPSNVSLFSFVSYSGSANPSMFFIPGQRRSLELILFSKTAQSQSFSVVCKGSFCSNVKISQQSFVLDSFDDGLLYVNVSMPFSNVYGFADAFDIVASNSQLESQIVHVSVTVSKFGLWFSKLSFNTVEGDAGFLFRLLGVPVPKVLFYFLVVDDSFNVTIAGNVIDPDISACGVISSSGIYTLNQSISTYSEGADIFFGWNFTSGWTTYANGTIINSTAFGTTPLNSGGIRYVFNITAGNTYRLIIISYIIRDCNSIIIKF